MRSESQENDAASVKRERAEASGEAQASRKRRIQLTLAGALIGMLVVAGLVWGLLGGEGQGEANREGGSSPRPPEAVIPAVRTTGLAEAAKLAGATFTKYRYDYGTGNHVTTPVKYPQNPPTNGPHHPQWASDGNYVGAATPPTEQLVHALEHGRIEIQYRPGLPQAQIEQLVALYDEDPAHVLLFENATDMAADVAVTAWAHGMLVKSFSPAVFDAIRAFRDTYRDQAPEKVA